MGRFLTTEEFIRRAIKVHGNKYDYSHSFYVNSKTKVCIICPEHGEFWQRPNDHLQGRGCHKCKRETISNSLRGNKKEFILKSSLIHGDKYDYSRVEYINDHTKVCIICPEHGEFWQIPNSHLNGRGCPKCGVLSRQKKQSMKNDVFIKRANETHHNKYDYSKIDYINGRTKTCIICKEHGEFWQIPHDHLDGHGCPICAKTISSCEEDIAIFLSGILLKRRDRSILNGKEIDIYIPSLKLGIEYNGLRWHSEEFGKNSHYHIEKLNKCNKQSVSLIQIFEDEWINHREICESKLKHICGLNHDLPKIFARKCNVNEISNKEAKEFLNTNHIQGFASSTVYLGCFNGEQLVGVMSFKREKDGYWDLNRFATDINYQCIGVGGKLFKYFINHYNFKEIKSFADRRWTTNPNDNLYTKLGFEFVEFTKPDYRYIKGGIFERFHKFGFRKQILHKKYGLPLTMTESEMTKELGYSKIWDCGLIKYIYKIKGDTN